MSAPALPLSVLLPAPVTVPFSLAPEVSLDAGLPVTETTWTDLGVLHIDEHPACPECKEDLGECEGHAPVVVDDQDDDLEQVTA
jgi:hypothetical protein